MNRQAVPNEIIQAIVKSNRIMICAHAQPDGDAIGSSFALGYALHALGKEFFIYNESPMPDWLSFLECPSFYHTDLEKLPFPPELIIALDSGDIHRLGEKTAEFLPNYQSLVIDHHLGNPHYGTYNWVNPQMGATGEMIAMLIKALGVNYQPKMAESLYVALCTDTGNFTYGNTDSHVLECLIEVVKTPINISEIQEKLSHNSSLKKLKFWGQLFQEIQVIEEGRFAYAQVPYTYFEKYQVTKEDLEGFIEQIRRIKGVRVAMLMREDHKPHKKIVKVSLRSHGDDDVRSVLTPLGGGGHKNAAGLTVSMSMQEVMDQILPSIHNIW